MRRTLLTAAAFAALALAPLAGQAQSLGGAVKAPPAAPAPVLTASGACAADQMVAIRRGFADARQMTARSIAILAFEAERIQPHLVRFFGTGASGVVAKNFRIIAQGLDQRESRVAYECNHAGACRGSVFAYVRHGGRGRDMMGFCPGYFRAARTGQDSQGGIVIHEVSHLALRTRDHAYQPHGAEALAKDDPEAALMNADSYEYFAEFLPR